MKITRNLVGLLLVIVSCLGVISTQPVLAQGRPDLVWMRGGPTAEVLSMSYSPDGTHLAAGSKDGVIRVWRVADCVLERTFVAAEYSDQIKYVAFLPDGDRLISVTRWGQVSIYRLSDGEMGLHWTLAQTFISGAVSEDGTLFGVGFENGSVQVWRTADASPVVGFQADVAGWQVYSLSFSSDNQRLVTTGNVPAPGDTVRVWHLPDATLISSTTPVRGYYGSQPRARFLPGGYEMLTVCNLFNWFQFDVVDSTSGQSTRTFSAGGYSNGFDPKGFDVSPDGRFAAVGAKWGSYGGGSPPTRYDYQETHMVRVSDGVKVNTGVGYMGVFSPTGEYALCSFADSPLPPGQGNSMGVQSGIQFGSTSNWGIRPERVVPGGKINKLAASSSGTVVSTVYGGYLPATVQRASDGAVVSQSLPYSSYATVSADGSTVLMNDSVFKAGFKAYNTADWSLISDLGPNSYTCCLSRNGSLAAFSVGGSATKIVRVADNQEVANIASGTGSSSSIEFTHDGTMLAYALPHLFTELTRARWSVHSRCTPGER
jgi:hypothetical protein